MADNYTFTAGSGTTGAADDISSVLYPRIKLIHGADGTNDGDVSTANPFPVELTDNNNSVVADITAILADTAAMDTNLATLAGAVSGTEMQVDVLTMPSVTVDSEFPAAAAITDNFANPTTTSVMAMGMAWDGSAWDRIKGDSTDGLLVNLGTNNDVTLATLPDTAASDLASMSADLGTIDTDTGNIAAGFAIEGGALGSGVLIQGDDGTDRTNVLVDTDGHLQVDILSGGGSNASVFVDDAGFTVASSSVTAIGAMFDDTATDSVDEGDVGIPRMSADRRLYTDTEITAALPAGTNAIGKLASNSGVDIGDVDVLSIAAGTNVIGKMRLVTALGDEITEDTDDSMKVTIVADDVGVGGGTEATDDTTTLATGSTKGKLMMAAATPTDGSVDANDIGALAMSTDRRLHVDADIVAQSLTNLEVGTVDTVTAVTDITNTIDSTISGDALTALQLIDDIVHIDDTATHATGTTKGAGIMAAATPTDGSVTANDIGMLAMSLDRRLHVDADLTAASGVTIDTSNVTIGAALPAGDNNIGNVDIASSVALDVSAATVTVDLGANNDVTIDGSSVVFTDDTSTHTAATTQGLGIMAVATPTDTAVDANDIAMPAMSLDRRLHIDADITAQSVGALDVSAATVTVSATQLDIDNLNATDDVVAIGDGSNTATIRNLAANDALNVAMVDASGDQITSFGGGTQYTEDVAAASDPEGNAQILVRQDTPATLVSLDGDNVARRGTNYGAAYTQIVDSSGNFVDSFGGSGGTATADDSDFVAGTTQGTPVMGVYESSPTSVTDGDLGTVGISADRRLQVDADITAQSLTNLEVGTVDTVTAVTDITNTIDSTISGAALTALQLIDDIVYTDDSGFTVATDSVAAIGMMADETTPDSVTEGDVGIPRMTLTRKPYAVITDPTSENNAAVDGSGHLQVDLAASSATVTVDGSGVTQPVSGTITANAGTGDFNVSLQDGAGTDLTSTLVGADQSLDVNLTQSVALDVSAATVPVSISDISFAVADGNALGEGVLIQGDDGTDRKNINVDATTGDVQVDVTNTVTVDGSGVTQPVSGTVTANPASGTIDTVTTVTTATTLTGSSVAHDGIDGGTNPHKIGGRAQEPTTALEEVADNDRVDAAFDRQGRLAIWGGYEVQNAAINDASSGDNTIVAAAGAGKRIAVLSWSLISDGTVDARWEDGAAGTAFTGQYPFQAREGIARNGNGIYPLWIGTANTLLNLELSAAINVHGDVSYIVMED